ncbi:34-kDa subunit of RNA polymerase III (C) [Xylographa opegraphella]|nr:34-kDa subunit of RNA polymerase III (C) [Xylographa opegraphella]
MATNANNPQEAQPTPSSPKELCNALYASCASRFKPDVVFHQEDIWPLKIIPNDNLSDLMMCINRLMQDGLLKLHNAGGSRAGWKVVSRENAKKYQNLTIEEALVYSYVESSGREGIWTRTIRSRTNLHQTTMNRCLKILESKILIKPIKSAKFPKRKIYILAHLQPSDDVTGGAFYTDGTLDEEFVNQLCIWAERYVLGRSWYHPPIKPLPKIKGKSKLSAEEADKLRAEEFRVAERERATAMIPMPAGYRGYPTVSEITKAVNESGVSEVVLKEAEMRQLMEILCWDNRLMKVMGGRGFKAVRLGDGKDGSKIQNGLTEAPCGRCPVFDLCEESGPVNARTCTYFLDWLA